MSGRRAGPLLFALLLAGALHANPELDAAFPQSSVVITAERHACYRFDVHVALQGEQWARGLMHVRAMPADRGMLFVYPDSARRSMWMKNTFIPLDMLFIRADGTIASIARDTEPQSLRSIAAAEPVRYVLELNAGTAARLGIEPGGEVLWAGDAN